MTTNQIQKEFRFMAEAVLYAIHHKNIALNAMDFDHPFFFNPITKEKICDIKVER